MVVPRQENRGFVRLGPAVREEASLEASWSDFYHLLGQIHQRRGDVQGRAVLKGLELLYHPLGHFRMAMSESDGDDTAEEVQKLLPASS